MGEFLNKFPDRKNVTFEETDGGLEGRMSLSVLPSIRRTQSTIASCTVVIGIGYRDTGMVSMCGLTAPKRRTKWSTTLLQGKVLFHMVFEVFMPPCKS